MPSNLGPLFQMLPLHFYGLPMMHFKGNRHWITEVLLLFAFINSVPSQTIFHSPDLPVEDLYEPGDINLGALVRLYYPSPQGQCSNDLARVGIQVAQAIKWTTENINRNNAILPNVTLGYVLLNDCGREGVALARSTKFLPPSMCLKDGCGNEKSLENDPKSARPLYKVAGMLGPYSSSLSVAVSSMLSLYKVPHVSWSATSQELSNKARFEYFSRTVPPDQYQSAAIIDILKHFNWTYISTIHAEGSYGLSGIREVQRLAKAAGICIAYSKELRPDDTEEDYDNVIHHLRKHPKARVIVAFTVGYAAEGILRAVRRAKATEFIFVGSDGFQPTLEFDNKPIDGLHALILNIKSLMDEDFKSYYTETVNPWRGEGLNVDSPWYGEYTPEDAHCESTTQGASTNPCSKYEKLIDFPQFFLFPGIGRVIDIVKTYSKAFHSLIQNECPQAFKNKRLLDSCISGPKVLRYLRNVSFKGSSGYIAFDSSGDLLGDYIITQVRGIGEVYSSKEVGLWSRLNEKLELDDKSIVWDAKYLKSGNGSALDKPIADIDTTDTDPVKTKIDYVFEKVSPWPESVCAKPCQAGEYYIIGELKCCWDCRQCRPNERVREDSQGCVLCPELQWPDQKNFSSCEHITPSYMPLYEAIGVGLICLGVAGFASVVYLVYVFLTYSDKKVIKGSSRELMAPIMIGLFCAYFTVFVLIVKPQNWSCYTSYFTFNLACTLIFGPLFLKTYRLYRIFRAAERCVQDIKMVNARSQVILLAIIVIMQVVIISVTAILLPPGARERMPVRTVMHVELLCHLPLESLLAPLSFNLFLLFLCALFGFLTRKLPDNYNESWYIFISVTTTLFVWIAFFPTYFVAFYAYHKSALLALALILNGVVTTLCLFAPKIYAVYYVDEKRIKVTNWGDYEDTINDSVTNTTSIGTIANE